MSTRASALRIQIDLTEQGAQTDFEVSQALRRLADQIANRRFTGLGADAQGDLVLERNFGTYVRVGGWTVDSEAEGGIPQAELAHA